MDSSSLSSHALCLQICHSLIIQQVRLDKMHSCSLDQLLVSAWPSAESGLMHPILESCLLLPILPRSNTPTTSLLIAKGHLDYDSAWKAQIDLLTYLTRMWHKFQGQAVVYVTEQARLTVVITMQLECWRWQLMVSPTHILSTVDTMSSADLRCLMLRLSLIMWSLRTTRLPILSLHLRSALEILSSSPIHQLLIWRAAIIYGIPHASIASLSL